MNEEILFDDVEVEHDKVNISSNPDEPCLIAQPETRKVIQLFVINNGRSKQFGITRLCHNWDWRIDLYFWSWTIWLEEVEVYDE